MNYYVFSGLLNTLTCFGMAFFVFWKNRRSPLNKAFLCFAISIALWAFFYTLWLIATDASQALFWIRWAMLWSTVIPFAFLEFVIQFIECGRIFIIPRLINAAIGVFIICFAFHPWFISGVNPAMFFPYWPRPGAVFYLFHIFFIANVIAGHLLMLLAWRKARGVARKRVMAVTIVTAIGFLGGMTNHFLWYRIMIPPFGNILLALFIPILGYAIIAYRFLDIEVIVKKTLVFAGLTAFVFAVFTAVSLLLQSVLSDYIGINRWLSLLVSVVLIVLGYDKLRAWIVDWTEQSLFQKEVDYEKIDRQIADQIQITDLGSQLKNIIEIFKSGLMLENGAVFVLDTEKKVYRLSYHSGYDGEITARVLNQNDPTIAYLCVHAPDVVLKEVLVPQEAERLGDFLSTWKAEVCVKIPFRETVIAILLLGKKKSDRDYTQKDTDFLNKLAKSLGVSINNAVIFHMKESYYALMAEKNKTDVLARLSEGIDHEIKNPLNAIKPAAQRIDAMLKKSGGPPDTETVDRLQEYVQMIIRNSDRIVAIMTRLRNFARPIRNSQDFKLEPLKLRDQIEEAIELVSRKQLELDGIAGEDEVGEDIRVYGERTSVVQVFWNLIGNAYHAINKNGKVRITARRSENDGKIIVTVADTGKGITPENMEKVFTPFFTTKPTNLPPDGSIRFTGTGLGLCYVKQYMENLGGSIICDSRVNEGTTFFLKFLRAGE